VRRFAVSGQLAALRDGEPENGWRQTLISRSSATRAVVIALVGAVAVTIFTGCGEDKAAKRYEQSVSAPLARMDGVVADARRAISNFESGEASFGNTEDRMTDLASRARSLKDPRSRGARR
jgi:hypothetical protein